MTLDAIERSEQSGAPVELYEFYVEDVVYRYTSAEQDVVVAGQTYTTEPITRTAIALSNEQPRNAITLSMRRNHPVADLFRIYPPGEAVGLIVKRYHRGDTDVGTLWVGRVMNVTWENTSTAKMLCEPASISVNRNGLGRYYQVPCPYALYNPDDCGVSKASFAHATTITSVNGTSMVVGSVGSHPYPGGYVEWASSDSPPRYERRLILGRTSLTLTLNRPFAEAVATDAVTLYPGCDHTISTCDTVFNNKLNYGGFVHMPKKNPFTATPVY